MQMISLLHALYLAVKDCLDSFLMSIEYHVIVSGFHQNGELSQKKKFSINYNTVFFS